MPEPLKRSDVVHVLKCSLPESVKQDLQPISLTSQFAKIMEGFTLSAVLNQFSDNLSIFTNLHLRRNRPPMLFSVFFMASFSPLTMVMCLHVYSLLISAKVSISRTIAFWSKSSSFQAYTNLPFAGSAAFYQVGCSEFVWMEFTISARGGIPQGTRLAPLVFAILVNNLSREWRNRLKYVDDTSVFEIIPRLSLSLIVSYGWPTQQFRKGYNWVK